MRRIPVNPGERFGMLEVIQELNPTGKEKKRTFEVRCDCGATKTATLVSLRNRGVSSCGCEHLSDRSGAPPPPVEGACWIPTTQGRFMLVDEIDYPEWREKKIWVSQKGYAMIHGVVRGERKNVFVHRAIMSIEDRSVHVDHISGDKLDNRRCNLRVATNHQNRFNQKPRKANQYKGVYRCYKRWVAQITLNYKRHYLGIYKTEEEAALAYNKAAVELFGEFARLNQIRSAP